MIEVEKWGGGGTTFLETPVRLVVLGEGSLKFDVELCVIV